MPHDLRKGYFYSVLVNWVKAFVARTVLAMVSMNGALLPKLAALIKCKKVRRQRHFIPISSNHL
jgi:hypothetical protein